MATSTPSRSRTSSSRATGTGAPPPGTVTFLFTDLESQTPLWEEHVEAMRGAMARHDAILRRAVLAHDGRVVKGTGDGLHAAFARAADALGAALAAAAELLEEHP